MERFTCSISPKIIFGKNSLYQLPDAARGIGGTKALIISGPHLYKIGLVDQCRIALMTAGIDSDIFVETEGNPSTETVERATRHYHNCHADFIVAFGGGSPLDVAKAVAVLARYGGKIQDYEGAGKIPGKVVPMIAIPTTAGTGSEVTAFAVITDHSRNYKLTVASNELLPKYAILDPTLIQSVPKKTAAACGVDAFVHALESYLSKAASPFSELFSLKAMELIGGAIRDYVANPENEAAAEAMLLGSMYAGIAFSHAKLGDVHAMSHPVSAYFDVPHGVANAILLPWVVAFNLSTDQGKYQEIYRCLCPRKPVVFFESRMLIDAIKQLNADLGIPASLSEVGVSDEFFDAMAEDAMKSGNIAVNPRKTTKADILEMYRESY